MDVQVNTRAGEVIVKSKDGWEVDVREFNAACGYTGDMASGEHRTLEDGSTVTRAGGVLVWVTGAR